MPKFRKKPVVVEARRVVSGDFGNVMRWCGGTGIKERNGRWVGILVTTLEGNHRADIGDWIIKGVKGEFYPCKPDIFEETYEPVTDGKS